LDKDDYRLPHDSNWSWIWKLEVSENTRFFVWLIIHGKIPNNSVRFNHHMTNDASCPRCGAAEETILHTLRDCPKAKRIWDMMRFSGSQIFLVSSCYDSFTHCASEKNGQLFLISCWYIWKARNEELFSDTSWEDWKVLNLINTHHDATIRSFGSVHNHREARLVSWKPPSGAAVKLNVDGSSLGNPGRSGFGGLIRDTNGNWLLGFSGSCGITTNINAELQAIFYGLEKAWSHGYRHVECESDCQSALKLIKEGVPTIYLYAPIIDLIKRFIILGFCPFIIHLGKVIVVRIS
jgi:hypothetical protein